IRLQVVDSFQRLKAISNKKRMVSSLLRNRLKQERSNITIVLYDKNSFNRSISCTFLLVVSIKHGYIPATSVTTKLYHHGTRIGRGKSFTGESRRWSSRQSVGYVTCSKHSHTWSISLSVL